MLEEVEISRQFLLGLLERMGMAVEVEGMIKDGYVCLDIKGDKDGMLIGKHGRTLEAIELIINRMVNRRVDEPLRVLVDIDRYRERRAESLAKMAAGLGEKARKEASPITVGPYNSHDRRIIHLALREDPSVETESFGEGPMKKLMVRPKGKEKGFPDS